MRILVVEDEQLLAESVGELLEDESYAVDLAHDGEAAARLKAMNIYDLVILDWTIPAPTGIELLGRWRADGDQTPVLMLTGRTDVHDKVDGLDAGADDYLTKPFSLGELLARVRSLLRRRPRPLKISLEVDDLRLDRPTREITLGGQRLETTPKEFAILEYMLDRLGEVVTRTEITEHVWNESFDAMSNTVDVTVYRLRKKIDGDHDKKLIHTVRGVGYVLKSERC